MAPGDPSATSAVTVSNPATKGTRVGSELSVIFVNGMAESEDTNTKSEDRALSTWPLMVATGLSELKVWPPRITASGEPDARDAVTVRSAATSVECSVGIACKTDGSVKSGRLCSPDAAGVEMIVDSVVGAGSWFDREDVAASGSPLLDICESSGARDEVVPSASVCPVESGCSWD